jgi:hypothetical protein
VRILLLSNMYPSSERPEYGVFVRRLADALRARGRNLVLGLLRPPREPRQPLGRAMSFSDVVIASSFARSTVWRRLDSGHEP